MLHLRNKLSNDEMTEMSNPVAVEAHGNAVVFEYFSTYKS